MKLGSMDPALACSGPMSTFSYDSHPVSRGKMFQLVDELPKAETKPDADYDLHQMDLEIQRVARELYRAFNGMNEGFKEVISKYIILLYIILYIHIVYYFICHGWCVFISADRADRYWRAEFSHRHKQTATDSSLQGKTFNQTNFSW